MVSNIPKSRKMLGIFSRRYGLCSMCPYSYRISSRNVWTLCTAMVYLVVGEDESTSQVRLDHVCRLPRVLTRIGYVLR